MCPAKYFLQYTANPISSFRKLCNVNSRVPFMGQLGPCLLRAPIILSANKMHTEGLSLPAECAPASLPRTHPRCCCHFLWQSSHGRGRSPSENGEKIELSPSQAQPEANFNSTVNPGGLSSWQPCRVSGVVNVHTRWRVLEESLAFSGPLFFSAEGGLRAEGIAGTEG